ncbi:MAG TPA: FixH family protein [Gillisia sp.]|nr:FixH family protein [Gillisia sp.]
MRIKISWGTSIVIAIVSFMTFILYLVITMTTNQEFNHDLVIEDYYKQELLFQDQMAREANSHTLARDIEVEKTSEGMLVDFPPELDPTLIQGKIMLYRPSNKEQDFNIPIQLNEKQLLIPASLLEAGRWNIIIDWSYDEEKYYYKKEFTF